MNDSPTEQAAKVIENAIKLTESGAINGVRVDFLLDRDLWRYVRTWPDRIRGLNSEYDMPKDQQ